MFEFFEAAFAQIPDFDKKRAILIGDSLTSDIKGANNAGVDACWYNPEGKKNNAGCDIRSEIKNLQELYDIL